MNDTTTQAEPRKRCYLDIDDDFSKGESVITSITTFMVGYGNEAYPSQEEILNTGSVISDATKRMRKSFQELLDLYAAERKAREALEVQS